MSFDDNAFAPGSDSSSSSTERAYSVEPVDLDVGTILHRATDLFTNNVGVVIGALLIPLIPALAFAGVDMALAIAVESANEDGAILAMSLGRTVVSIVSGLTSLFFQLGVIRIFLNISHGRDADLGMLLSGGGMLLQGLGVAICVGIATVLGLVAFVIPGIIVAVGLQFALYCMVDRDLGVIEAISDSWELTSGHKLTVFLINLLIGILGLVFTCVTFGVGYILIVPVLNLVQAVMYQSLRKLQADLA